MIVVRMTFRARFGRGGAYAARFAERNPQIIAELEQALGTTHPWRVLTDRSGDCDTVVLEVGVASLAAWGQVRGVLFGLPAFRTAAAEPHGLLASGHGRFWTVVAAG